MATNRVSKAAADAAKSRAALVEHRSRTMSRDTFLRSQGPKVIELQLPVWDIPVLMRRVDLLQLARAGRHPQPITSAIVSVIQHGGLLALAGGRVVHNALDADHLMATLDASAAIAMASLIAPPPEYLSGEAEETIYVIGKGKDEQGNEVDLTVKGIDIDPRECLPLFVPQGEEPGEGQVVLDWITPAEQGADGYDEAAELAHGRMHPKDLAFIFGEAYRLGPGSLGAEFRKAPDALASVERVADIEPARPALKIAEAGV